MEYLVKFNKLCSAQCFDLLNTLQVIT